MALKCPHCGRKLEVPWILQNTIVRCKCGTRVTVAPGFWRKKIVDWETPKESAK